MAGRDQALPDLEGRGALDDLRSYITQRTGGADYELRDLPVPESLRQVFRDWADNRVNFVEFLAE